MSFTQLRAFHAVVENKGFTAAARFLNVSQSTITMQVRELELTYNVELFHRKGRSILPTQSGKALHKITTRLIQAHNESLKFLKASKTLETGNLRIAAVGPFHATEMASAFKVRYPGVEIELQFGNSNKTLESLLNLNSDIAILADVEEHPLVMMERYSEHKAVIFVHRDHKFFNRKSIKISELENEDFILREKGSTTRHAFEAALEKHEISINRVMEIGSREGVWKAVTLGLGIGVVADFEFVPAPELQAIIIEDANILTNYYIAYLRDHEDDPLIKAFRTLIL